MCRVYYMYCVFKMVLSLMNVCFSEYNYLGWGGKSICSAIDYSRKCSFVVGFYLPLDAWNRLGHLIVALSVPFIYEPRCEKNGLRGFRPGLTQTRLYNHTRSLEA